MMCSAGKVFAHGSPSPTVPHVYSTCQDWFRGPVAFCHKSSYPALVNCIASLQLTRDPSLTYTSRVSTLPQYSFSTPRPLKAAHEKIKQLQSRYLRLLKDII